MKHPQANPERAARVRAAILATDPRTDSWRLRRLLEVSFRLIGRKYGFPPAPLRGHWRIHRRDGGTEVVRGRNDTQASERLSRRLRHVNWSGYGCPV